MADREEPEAPPPSEPEPEPEPRPQPPRLVQVVLARLARVRRSTWLVVVAVAVVAAVLGTVLTVVQRMQVSPLAPDAEQVARLPRDSGYLVPTFFSATTGDDRQVRAYTPYQGLGVVLIPGGSFGSGDGDSCISVYSEAAAARSTANGFDGAMYWGCGAGEFPPTVQFRPGKAGFSVEDVGGAAALQFVHDSATDEVVVFREAVEE